MFFVVLCGMCSYSDMFIIIVLQSQCRVVLANVKRIGRCVSADSNVLVFIHELGHFLVAKANGVKVLKFSLGFGPKLISKKWGETEYLVCAVPLGGYVQMLGEGLETYLP